MTDEEPIVTETEEIVCPYCKARQFVTTVEQVEILEILFDGAWRECFNCGKAFHVVAAIAFSTSKDEQVDFRGAQDAEEEEEYDND